ncbi:MAG: ornithine carbamoyltransferase [Alphaproteobacteria bacterium]|nr:MAG: ornithine carbamoyltransferase [Alphaproteobacteria bacterium]
MRHFLDIRDRTGEDLVRLLDLAKRLKTARAGRPKGACDDDPALAGRRLLMLFEKPSTRTRLSFDLAIRQLGGDALDLDGAKLQLGRGESIEDTARILSLFGDAIAFRGRRHADLLTMAGVARVPVINALTDRSHPCQALADLLTIREEFGRIEGLAVAYLGDANNVARSLMEAVVTAGGEFRLACPADIPPDEDFRAFAAAHEGRVRLVHDAGEAATGADVIYTDTWHSMGLEHGEEANAIFAPFRVDAALMARAADHAIFLHCLPAHRGEEVVAEVIDGPASRVWRQAENRLHAQKAILIDCLAD